MIAARLLRGTSCNVVMPANWSTCRSSGNRCHFNSNDSLILPNRYALNEKTITTNVYIRQQEYRIGICRLNHKPSGDYLSFRPFRHLHKTKFVDSTLQKNNNNGQNEQQIA
jgi:hypothetical protein